MTEPIPSLLFWPGRLAARGFPALLEGAAAGDFARMAVSPLMVRQLRTAGLTDPDIIDVAADSGVRLTQLDGVSSWAPVRYGSGLDLAVRQCLDFSAQVCLDMAAELQLDSILAVGAFDHATVPTDVLVESFGEFCDAARVRDLRVELQFGSYAAIPDLPTAWNIVHAADRPNSGLIINTWHLFKGSTDLQRDLGLLATIAPQRLATIQLALPAQAGDIGQVEVVRLVEARGGLTTIGAEIGTEIFDDTIDAMSTVEAGRHIRAATEGVLRQALGR